MLLQVTYTEPIIVTGALVGGGGTILWFARMSLKTFGRVERICQALWGAPEGDGSDGVISLIHKQSGAMGVLGNENEAIRSQLKDIKHVCELTHPRQP